MDRLVSPRTLKTPVSLPLRLWLGMEILFGIAAISAVFLRPYNTEVNFAWPIKPTVMAATLGAFYASVGLLFVAAIFVRYWQNVRVVVLPGAAFTAVMLLNTLLHWDKFAVGIPPFYVWFASYLLPPPIFVALYGWHQKRSAPVGVGITQALAPGVQTLLRVNGWIWVGLAIVVYGFPGLLMAIAPWQFTPLTARTLCGWLVGIGLLQVSMACEGDWLRARLGSAMLIALPLALVFQLLRYRQEVQWSNLPLWIALLDFGAVALVLVTLWVNALRPRSMTQLPR